MSRQEVSVPTPDGAARAFVFTPEQGAGPWPAVIFYMDAFSLRPALFEMGERLASNGYYVPMPDMYWRLGAYGDIGPGKVDMQELFGRYMGSTDPVKSMRDTGGFLDWLGKQPKAKAEKVGVMGYCMGGALALRAAGNFPDKVAAAAAFHAGFVVNDQPDSPHLLAPKMKAKVLVAGADEDAYFTEEQCAVLDKAMKEAGVDAEVGIYKGAKHGYAVSDLPVFDTDASERHWREMLALFGDTLKETAAA